MSSVLMRTRTLGLICILFVGLQQTAHSLNNGLALTPPMGWISWVRFMCEIDCNKYPNDCINDKLYMDMANRMAEDGYLNVGYDRVNIDDCWSEKTRGTDSRLVPDARRFPNGMKTLSSYIHSKGLKFGIYGDCGTLTCAKYPAQLKTLDNLEDNYFETDANLFADWEVDSLKFDGCFIDPMQAEGICPKMAKALNETNREILLSCEWPFYKLRLGHAEPDYRLAADSCNLWRYYDDVEDSWSSILAVTDWTIKLQETIVKYHGPGHWFDPDQLVIGNFGLSLDQAKAQMALWAIWSAPLYMSNDLRKIEPEMAAILKNKHVISVDQDQLGVFGMMVNQTSDNSIQVWVKPVEPIKNGCPSFAIVYLNRHTLGDITEVSFNLRDILKKAPIGLAEERQNQLYRGKIPAQDRLVASDCRKRILNAMKLDPESIPQDLINSRPNQPNNPAIEYTTVLYKVYDLLDEGKVLDSLGLSSNLTLKVHPSGARMIKLVEN